ncbi:MAG TPA: hypothetical protein DCY20_08670, partial [Firmicutes bacterium]|nr:hypothetical protein [Bacillota bacterium]
DGTAVFKENKMVGYLTENETRGLIFLRNHIKETLYPGKTDKVEYSTVQIYKANRKITMTQKNDNIIMNIHIKASGNLKEFLLGSDIEFLSDGDVNQLEQNIASQIEDDCRAVIDKAMNEYGVDLFYFGDMIWKSDPDLWKTIKEDQIDYLKKINVQYTIEVNLNRVGLEQVLETK